MVYAITGASGQLGRRAAESLMERVDPSQVVLLTRTPSSLQEFADRGAAVRAADFADADGLRTALRGVERLLLISVDAVGARLEKHRTAIDAAKAADVAHVLYTSVPNPVDGNPAVVVPDHKGTEEYLAASGLGWTFLRNNIYAEVPLHDLREALHTGRLVTNAGDGGTAYVTRDDCAAAAVGALVSARGDAAVDVSGLTAYTAYDLARIAAAKIGSEVEVVQLDDAAYTASLIEAGLPHSLAELLSAFGASAREGYLDTITTAVQDLAGHAPTPLETLI